MVGRGQLFALSLCFVVGTRGWGRGFLVEVCLGLMAASGREPTDRGPTVGSILVGAAGTHLMTGGSHSSCSHLLSTYCVSCPGQTRAQLNLHVGADGIGGTGGNPGFEGSQFTSGHSSPFLPFVHLSVPSSLPSSLLPCLAPTLLPSLPFIH